MDEPRTPSRTRFEGERYARSVDPLVKGVYDFVASHLPDGDRVIDAACRTGAIARRLVRDGRDVLGIDLAPANVEHARVLAAKADLDDDRLRFEVGDVAQFDPPEEGPYDVGVLVFGLHDLPREERVAVLGNLLQIARCVYAVDFAAPMPWNISGMRNRAAEAVAGRTHLRLFRAYQRHGGLRSLVDEVGAEVRDARTIDAGTLDVMTLAAGDSP